MRIALAIAVSLLMAAWFAVAQAPVPGATTPALDAQRADGAALFKQHCATCHGADARGGGPEAPAMHFRPGDLTTLAMENNGVFPSERVKQIIEGRGPAVHGSRLMPVWGDVFMRTGTGRDSGRQRVESLALYLDSIQRRPAD